jgi:hypothetical protein
VNVRGPSIDRPRNRAWVLLALLTLAAFTINPPLMIRVQIGLPDSERSAPPVAEPRPPVVRVHVTAAFRPETDAPTSPDYPPAPGIELPAPAALISAPVPNVASDQDAVDQTTPFVLDKSTGTPVPEVYTQPAPAALDPDIVRTAFVPEPNAAPATSDPGIEVGTSIPADGPGDSRAFPDSLLDLSRDLSTSEQPVGPLFPVPVFDDYERLPTPPPLTPEPSATPGSAETRNDALPTMQVAAPSDGTSQTEAASLVQASPNNSETGNSREDEQVKQTGCATCGGFHSDGDGLALHDLMNCANGGCIPGRAACNAPAHESDTVVGALLHNLYQCLCCPDPCYEPRWEPAANASFFADYARPRTVTRIRYDNLENLVRPDRNEFWMMQVQPTQKVFRKLINLTARLQEVYVYQEAAGARGSFFIEYGYRQLNSNFMPTQAGFSDLNFGVKSLFFDCELLQLAFQFRTYTPTGNATLGLGTGHVSLDPSILASLKLGPETYFQGQFGNWVPIGSSSPIAGGMFYAFTSLNQVLWYPSPDSPLIGTLEMDVWSFENGGYTNALEFHPGLKSSLVEKGGGVSYFNIGPGLRQTICNRLDFGGAITWAPSNVHWAEPWFRFEVRFLF